MQCHLMLNALLGKAIKEKRNDKDQCNTVYNLGCSILDACLLCPAQNLC